MFPTDDYLASAVAETKRKKGMLPYSIFPYIAIPGSQIDACTYSYFDDPSLAKIADSSLKGTDNLEVFLSFCREHGYEAFWATRMNDTHDAADTDVHDLSIELNGRRLGSCRRKNTWLHYPVNTEIVSTGVNQIVVVLDKKSRTKPLLHDIALSIRYPRHSGGYCK